MVNPYVEYYVNQAGSGISGFQGIKYQRGHGFFGTIFSQVLKPLFKYLGRQALTTGVGIGQDILEGNNLKTSVNKRLKETGGTIINDGLNRFNTFAQTGKGKRKRSNKSVKAKATKKKVTKKKTKKRVTKKSKKKVKKKSEKKQKTKSHDHFKDLLK